MKKWLLLPLLLLGGAAWAGPNIIVQASAVTILGSSQTISITVQLVDPNNTGVLKVSGTGVMPVMRATTVRPGSTATVGPIYGNDVILDAFGNANTTYYMVQVFTVNGGILATTPALQNFYAFAGSGTVDLSTATPLAPSFMSGRNGSVVVPGTFTVNNAGVFTNTQMNLYSESRLNSFVPATSYFATNASYATSAILGGTTFSSGSTVVGGYGVMGMVDNYSTTTEAGGAFFSGRCLATNTDCWGDNPLVQDAAGISARQMTGQEIDVNILGTPAAVHALQIAGGGGGTYPTDTTAIFVNGGAWRQGINFINSSMQPNFNWMNVGYPFVATSGTNYPAAGANFHANVWNGSVGVDEQWFFQHLTNASGTQTFDAFLIGNIASPSGNIGVAVPKKLLICSNGTCSANSSAIADNSTAPNTLFNLPSTAGTFAVEIASGTTKVTAGNSVGCVDQTATATGATTAMKVIVSPVSPQTDTIWAGYVSASNTVDIHVCTIVALTGSAVTYNWSVIP